MALHRSERVAEAIREELEEMIGYEMSDPRIQSADVLEVLLSPDGRHARVRLNVHGEGVQAQETIEALEHARHYLRREIAQRLDIFRVPDLHFEAAVSTDLGARAPHLLKRVRRGRPREPLG